MPNLYIDMHYQMKNCLSRKIWKNYYSMLLHWWKWVGKCLSTFHQLLIYWKIWVSRNNLQIYTFQFLICFFKFSSITYQLSSILSNNCNNAFPPLWSSCIVIIPGAVFEEEQATIYTFSKVGSMFLKISSIWAWNVS